MPEVFKTDGQLVSDSIRGRLSSFEVLVKRYQDAIIRYTNRILKDEYKADDAAQETFIKVYENLKRFDRKKPFKPWIYKIATNSCYDLIRKDKKFTSLSYDIEDGSESALTKVIKNEQNWNLRKAIASLPKKYKIPLIGYYFRDFSYKRLSEIMQIPENTLKTRLRRAKGYLGAFLESVDYER